MRWLALISLLGSTFASGEEALVAVATNFLNTARLLETEFERLGEHRLTLTAGSTGKLYAQIANGAPYDVFLAADQVRPELLEESGLGVAGTRFTYAAGRLVIWSEDRARMQLSLAEVLRESDLRAIAIANPRLAPYGQAAVESLASLEVLEAVEDKLVFGENVGQAFALAATANAELGLVALSQVSGLAHAGSGAYIEIDARHHRPIRQDAILLMHGAGNPAASAFLAFLKSDAAMDLIAGNGYGRPDGD